MIVENEIPAIPKVIDGYVVDKKYISTDPEEHHSDDDDCDSDDDDDDSDEEHDNEVHKKVEKVIIIEVEKPKSHIELI